MKVRDFYSWLDNYAPFQNQESWDNSGFMCGDMDDDVTGVALTLDVTQAAVDEAKKKGANLIISHHPLIFKPVMCVRCESVLYRCISEKISVISAHTSMDVAKHGINTILASNLGIRNIVMMDSGIWIRGELPTQMSPMEFANMVKEKLGAKTVRYSGDGNVRNIGICCGGGGDFYGRACDAGCDGFLSGDIKHNIFIESQDAKCAVFDAGHFATEEIAIPEIAVRISKDFPDIKIVYIPGKEPFDIV